MAILANITLLTPAPPGTMLRLLARIISLGNCLSLRTGQSMPLFCLLLRLRHNQALVAVDGGWATLIETMDQRSSKSHFTAVCQQKQPLVPTIMSQVTVSDGTDHNEEKATGIH